MRVLRIRMVIAVVTVVVAAVSCSAGSAGNRVVAKPAQSVGPPEGTLTLLSLPGYVEGGGTDPRVDWVTQFEKRSGCRVNVRFAESMPQLLTMAEQDSFDGIVAPPEVAGQLIAAGKIAPVNVRLVDGYKDLLPRLRALPGMGSGGTRYGVPYVWGSDVIVYDTAGISQTPASWSALFNPAELARYKGRVVMRGSPLALADAALYLKAHQPQYGVSDPFALTPGQLEAATSVLRAQRPYVGRYWAESADAIDAFASNEAVLGLARPYIADVLRRAKRPVASVTPSEGTTGWVDVWQISATARHPNCMYQWLSWVSSPSVQQQVSEWLGVAPANPQACDQLGRRFCATYHVQDDAYQAKVAFARLPTRDCGSPGGRDDCTGYADWITAWKRATKQS